jgi:predicted GIY-YIG superfamily endonuclease
MGDLDQSINKKRKILLINPTECDYDDDYDSDFDEPENLSMIMESKKNISTITTRTKRQKYNHVPDEFCVYILRLMRPGSKMVYIGSTQNFSKRIAQHNCIIAGNSRKCKTRKYSCDGKYKWEPICVISSSDLNKELSLQLEYKLQHFAKYIKTSKLQQECLNNNPNLIFLDPDLMQASSSFESKDSKSNKSKYYYYRNWPINENGLKLEDKIKHLIFCLNLNKWTVKSTVSAQKIKMRLTWYRHHEKPKDSDIIDYFPPNILQTDGNMYTEFDYCNF